MDDGLIRVTIDLGKLARQLISEGEQDISTEISRRLAVHRRVVDSAIMEGKSEVRITINVHRLARQLAKEGKQYITVNQLARRLAVNPRVAGKILALMESHGLVVKRSRKAYKLVVANDEDDS